MKTRKLIIFTEAILLFVLIFFILKMQFRNSLNTALNDKEADTGITNKITEEGITSVFEEEKIPDEPTISSESNSTDSSDSENNSPENSTEKEEMNMTPNEKQAAELLEKMTLREKIYQMCIITPEQLGGEWPVTSVTPAAKDALAQYPVGGVIYFADHLKNPEQTRNMLSKMQEYAEENEQLPLFLCVDEEGGRVARIAENPAFDVKNVDPMGKISSSNDALKAGQYIGNYLSELGFNVDFAPDADVLTAPGSVIIGDRSFGDDPEKVTEYAAAVSNGLHESNILSCFKHYPGHGAVEADTHKGLAFTEKSLEDLLKCEMIPFIKAKENNVDMIMAAHISVPGILGDSTPCSLSKYMITTVLKEQLGYDGLIITDALNMGAIVQTYSEGEAAVLAVQAGIDILLMPPDLEKAVDAIETAVKNGEINTEKIDSAVGKIIIKKLSLTE